MNEFYLHLLIFSAVLSQGIAVLPYQEINKSSNLQVRKKRLINKSPGGAQPAHPTLSRHIVQFLVADVFECSGNILKANIILTVRNCLYGSDEMYTVLSGSLTKNSGTSHRVLNSIKHPHSNLALLKIHPPINLQPFGNEKIKLFTGPLPPNPSGLFSGWGCTDVSPEGERTYPGRLKAVLLPLITYSQCQALIRALHGRILDENMICTLDVRRERGACYGDEGGSLVYGGRLLGIYSHNEGLNIGVHPDVYVNLSDENLKRWIYHNIGELQRFRFHIA